jgi:hypothetical protein
VVNVRYIGGFGNNMYQYVFASLLAENNGLSLGQNLPRNGIIANTPNPEGRVGSGSDCVVTDIGQKNVLHALNQSERYLVSGYFQNSAYYLNERERIKGFFELPNIGVKNEDFLVAHVRLGDYKRYGPAGTVIDPQYYIDAIEKERQNGIERLIFLTDEPQSVYFENFSKYDFEVVSRTPREDFIDIMSSKWVVCSNSSFCWWACFFGIYERVYTFPKWLRGTDHCVDLHNLDRASPIDAGFWTIGEVQ